MLTIEQRRAVVDRLRHLLPGWTTQYTLEVQVRRLDDDGYLREYIRSLFSDAGWTVSLKQTLLAGESPAVVVYGTRPNSLAIAEQIAELLQGVGFPVRRSRIHEMTDAFIIVTVG